MGPYDTTNLYIFYWSFQSPEGERNNCCLNHLWSIVFLLVSLKDYRQMFIILIVVAAFHGYIHMSNSNAHT